MTPGVLVAVFDKWYPVTAKITMPDGSIEYRTFGTRAALEAWLLERNKHPVVEFII